ncbi:MAG: hypothetical protein ABFD49_10720 [Armatimonadota bacterium]|nr:hypothetical protein [bacterium]
MGTLTLLFCLVLPGVFVACVSGHFALVDWVQLQTDYHHFQAITGTHTDLKTVFIAYAAQDIHRTNLFADGVWTMLGMILTGLGVLGLCGKASQH